MDGTASAGTISRGKRAARLRLTPTEEDQVPDRGRSELNKEKRETEDAEAGQRRTKQAGDERKMVRDITSSTVAVPWPIKAQGEIISDRPNPTTHARAAGPGLPEKGGEREQGGGKRGTSREAA